MALDKLASELEETARQTAEMADGIAAGLAALQDASPAGEAARTAALRQIIMALQMQDRIEQRCRNMAVAARRMAHLLDAGRPLTSSEVWAPLPLGELANETPPPPAARASADEVEFF